MRNARACRSIDRCDRAGRCLCTPDGLALRTLRNSFHDNILNPLTPPKSAGRAALKAGDWAYLLRGFEPMGVGPKRMPLYGPPLPPQEVIFHIALMYLTLWRPTWQLLTRCEPRIGDPPETDFLIYTKVSH